MTLDQLFIKYGSDKSSLGHGYAPMYELAIPKPVTSILEIGVNYGASMRAWKEAFPDAKLYGLDLFTEGVPMIDGVNWIKGNQLDHDILYHIRNDIKPQIISEDCSHNCRDQWVTFYSLIGSCWVYIIEDLHSNYEESYQQGLKFDYTMLGSMLSGKFPFHFLLSENNKIAAIFPNYTTLDKYANTPSLPH